MMQKLIDLYIDVSTLFLKRPPLLSNSETVCHLFHSFQQTDFASHGTTRYDNVIDPHNCRTHQSLYTCLSQGSMSEGTILIQGFNSKKMTGFTRVYSSRISRTGNPEQNK
jgi:hypothetical protein